MPDERVLVDIVVEGCVVVAGDVPRSRLGVNVLRGEVVASVFLIEPVVLCCCTPVVRVELWRPTVPRPFPRLLCPVPLPPLLNLSFPFLSNLSPCVRPLPPFLKSPRS